MQRIIETPSSKAIFCIKKKKLDLVLFMMTAKNVSIRNYSHTVFFDSSILVLKNRKKEFLSSYKLLQQLCVMQLL